MRHPPRLLLPIFGLALAAATGGDACSNGPVANDAGADANGDAAPPESADVVVVGATAGGIAAAVEAARMGARVVLLEETDVIGGQFATQAVGPADDPGFNSASGLYGELREAARAHYAALGKTFLRAIEPHVAIQLFGKMLSDAGVTVTLRARVDSLDVSSVGGVPTVVGVHFTPHGAAPVGVTSKIVVDATDTGDVLALSPARFRAGNRTSDALDPSACVQSITYGVVLQKYSGGAPAELLVTAPPPGYDQAPMDAFFQQTGWTWDDFVRYRALPDSSSASDYDGGDPTTITKTIINAYNDYPITVADLDRSARAHAYCEAKLRTLSALYYIQTVTGHSDWALAKDEGYDTPYNLEEGGCPEVPAELAPLLRYFPPTPYVREGRRLIGSTTLTASEAARVGTYPNAVAAQAFPSSVAIDDYAFDLHGCSDESTLEANLESVLDVPDASPGVYSPGTYGPFQIPFEALIPETVDGLLAAEKNISVSRLVNGGTREHPDVMYNGMAVGALAALAVARGVQPRQVPAIIAQSQLVASTSALSLVTFADVPREAGAAWGDVEIATTHQLMRGVDAGLFDAAAPLLRGPAATLLTNLFSLPPFTPASPTFGDVSQGDADYAGVEAIYQAGLTSGCGGGNYCPNQPVLRSQIATFVVKALGLDPQSAPATPLYDDVSSDAGSTAFPYVQLLGQAQLLDPCAPTLFCPDAPLTRAQAAQVARRTLVYLANR